MNQFQELVNRMFKITEAYQLSEMSKDSVIALFQPLTKHILYLLENLSNERIKKSTLSDINPFVKKIENNFNAIEGKIEKRINQIEDRLVLAFRDGVKWYKEQYNKEIQSIAVKNLIEKSNTGNMSFLDFGLILTPINSRDVAITFSLELLLQNNK